MSRPDVHRSHGISRLARARAERRRRDRDTCVRIYVVKRRLAPGPGLPISPCSVSRTTLAPQRPDHHHRHPHHYLPCPCGGARDRTRVARVVRPMERGKGAGVGCTHDRSGGQCVPASSDSTSSKVGARGVLAYPCALRCTMRIPKQHRPAISAMPTVMSAPGGYQSGEP